MQTVVGEATVMLPLAAVIDFGAERARLAKERARIASDAEKTAAKLANPDFVSRAREEVVEENRERLVIGSVWNALRVGAQQYCAAGAKHATNLPQRLFVATAKR